MLLGVELIVFGDPQPAKRKHTEVTIISFITAEFSNIWLKDGLNHERQRHSSGQIIMRT